MSCNYAKQLNMTETIVVDIKSEDREIIHFINMLKMLRCKFCGNFLCLAWKNESNFHVIFNLPVVWTDSIKRMFCALSSNHCVNVRKELNAFLILDGDIFVCCSDHLDKLIELLHKLVTENAYVTACLCFNMESLSFKTEKKNKNDNENNKSFVLKLHNQMLRCKYMPIYKSGNPRRINKACPPRKSLGCFNLPPIPGGSEESIVLNCSYPASHNGNSGLPDVPSSQGSANTARVSSSQESLPHTEQHQRHITDRNDFRSNLQSHSHVNEQHLDDTPNSDSGNNHVPMEVDVLPNDSSSQMCVSGSSFHGIEQGQYIGISFDHASVSSTNYRLPPPAGVQQSIPFRQGLQRVSTSVPDQQFQQQHRATNVTEPVRIQAVPQQRNGTDDLLRVLGRVRSPEHADLMDRLQTFSRWPSDIAQTPAKVAEAGFYYTGFQDIVRCFACDGGLKNWDPEDDPWVEHARWFPQCAYVRHVKGEEFINLVRMMTDESDAEDDYTVHRGATWGGAENSNTRADSASNEIKEPSVLESEDAQIVIAMGFLEKDVAMAINDIFKKGKQDFTGQEIADIILEKETRGELSNSMLAVDCPPSVGNMSATEQAMSENKHLKELFQCTECKTRQRNILFLPCTHHVACELCSRDLHICTCCFRKIKEKVKTYMS